MGRSTVFFLPSPALLVQWWTADLTLELQPDPAINISRTSTDTCHDPLKTTRTPWERANELQIGGIA